MIATLTLLPSLIDLLLEWFVGLFVELSAGRSNSASCHAGFLFLNLPNYTPLSKVREIQIECQERNQANLSSE
jgi:hypothetical protein